MISLYVHFEADDSGNPEFAHKFSFPIEEAKETTILELKLVDFEAIYCLIFNLRVSYLILTIQKFFEFYNNKFQKAVITAYYDLYSTEK